MLQREFERLSLGEPNIADITDALNLRHSDEVYLGLVMGEIGLGQITAPLLEKAEKQATDALTTITKKPVTRPNKYKIDVDGLDNIELHLAKCCNPVHGEPIAGFITLSSGVSIHNKACHEYQKLIEDEPLRTVKAYLASGFWTLSACDDLY